MPIEHNNELKFVFDQKVQSFNFEFTNNVGDYSITPGQPFQGVNVTSEGNHIWILHIKAGRKGSEEVAKWFNTVGHEHMVATQNYAETPSKLNFAVRGTLRLSVLLPGAKTTKEFHCRNFYIAQGHNNRDRNNWWMGYSKMFDIDEHRSGKAVGYAFDDIPNTPTPMLIYISYNGTHQFNITCFWPNDN